MNFYRIIITKSYLRMSKVHKFLKYSSIIIIFAIILLLIAPFFVKLDEYKEIATQKVKEATGRKLEINGSMSLSLFPNPEIKIQDIKLSSIPDAQYPSLFESRELKVSLSLFSLFSGNIVISGIEITEAIINLERTKNNFASWEFSQQTDAKITKESNNITSEKQENNALSIKSLKILGAKINYIETNNDGSNTSNITIDDLEIKNFHGPDDLAFEFYSTGKFFNIKGDVQENKNIIILNTNLDLLKEKISISGNFDSNIMSFIGKLKLEGDAKSLKAVLPNFKFDGNLNHQLTLDVDANKNLVKITDININFGDLSVKGSSNYDIVKNKADLALKLNPGNLDIILTPSNLTNKGFNEKISIKATSLEPLINALKFEKLLPTGMFNKEFSLITDLSYLNKNLFFNDISLIIDKANFKGNVGIKSLNEDLTFAYDLKTNDLSAFTGLIGLDLPVNIDTIQIKGETIKSKDRLQTDSLIVLANTTNNIKGTVILEDSIKPSLIFISSGNNLGESLGILTKSRANNMLGSYSLSTKIAGDFKKIIEITIDKSSFNINKFPLNINGLLSLNLTNIKPKITTNLKIKSLNLGDNSNSNSSAVNLESNKEKNISSNYPWSDDKIDLSFLNKIDGDFAVTIEKIVKGGLLFDNIKIILTLANGVLDLKSLNGNMYGGRLDGSGQISSHDNQSIFFKTSLKGADIQNILHQDGKIKITQGKMNFDTDLKTRGQTQHQYISNLFGTSEITVSNGKISGFDLQKVIDSLQKIKSLDNVLFMLNSSFSGGETNFKQLDIHADIKEGVANIQKFKIDMPSVSLLANGNINLPEYSLDLSGVVNVDIKYMPSLKVNIYGSIDNPKHKLDTKLLQEYLIKNVLNDVVTGIKKVSRPEDLLKNIVGGTETQKDQSASSENKDINESINTKNTKNILEKQLKKGIEGLFK